MEHDSKQGWTHLQPGADPKIGVPVHFCETEFMDFVSSLYHAYPDEWVAIAVEHEDRETGEVAGTIIGHCWTDGSMGRTIADFRAAHPETNVRLFSTRMVRPLQRGR